MSAATLMQTLQARGFHIDAACGRLLVSPASLLTAEDRRDIRQHLRELLALAEDDREWLDERAGIAEFDGGMTRAQAETMAAELLQALRLRSRGAPA